MKKHSYYPKPVPVAAFLLTIAGMAVIWIALRRLCYGHGQAPSSN